MGKLPTRELIVSVTIFLLSAGDLPAIELTECQNLEVIQTPYPEYPSPEQARKYLPGTLYMHVFVEGFVTVKYDVTSQGTVSGAQIVETAHKPNNRADLFEPGYFDGFLEINVLPTIKRWTYKPVALPCTAQTTIKYDFVDEPIQNEPPNDP